MPLAPNKAVKIATEWFQKRGCGGGEFRSINIKIPTEDGGKPSRGLFYYVIVASNGPLDSISCVILSDGTVVEPIEKLIKD
jgi:hypothetical protein